MICFQDKMPSHKKYPKKIWLNGSRGGTSVSFTRCMCLSDLSSLFYLSSSCSYVHSLRSLAFYSSFRSVSSQAVEPVHRALLLEDVTETQAFYFVPAIGSSESMKKSKNIQVQKICENIPSPKICINIQGQKICNMKVERISYVQSLKICLEMSNMKSCLMKHERSHTMSHSVSNETATHLTCK
jgi:hypothetical protein